ncbi:MAG: hypothetical protein QW688_03875 [Thermoprotei archaeon]
MTSKRVIIAYVLALILYILIAGLASSYNPAVGITLLVVPIAFFVYRWLRRRTYIPIKVPILRLRKSLASSFYTDAPENEVRYAVTMGEELGVGVTAVLTKMPNTGIQAYKIVVYTQAITDKAVKQKLSFAVRSLVSLLSVKGYRVVPDSNIDESLITGDTTKLEHVFPVVVVFGDGDYAAAVSKAVDLTDSFVLLTPLKPHVIAALEALPDRVWPHIGVARFGYNFGFNLFRDMDGGFVADVAEVCFNLSTQSALILAALMSKASREGQPLNPFLLGDILEAETQSHELSSHVHDELYAFYESLKMEGVWRGVVKDHPTDKPSHLVVDLSQIESAQTRCFVAYTLAGSLTKRGETIIVDLSSFNGKAATHILNDLRLVKNCIFMVPKGAVKPEALKGFGVLVYMGADDDFKRIVGEVNTRGPLVDDNACYMLTKGGSLSPFSRKAAPRRLSEEEVEKLIRAFAPPIEVEDIAEKPYLPTIFTKEEVDAVLAAFNYVEKYTTVEETTFIQALGLKAHSVEVASKLVRLGFIKRKRRGGIPFVELTTRGHEELDRLRKQTRQA